MVRRAAITLSLTVQPCVIAELGINPAFEHLGLLDRFLFGMPRERVGWRNANPPAIDERVVMRYHEQIGRVLALCGQAGTRGGEQAVVLEFTAEAHAAGVAFEEWREPQLRPSGPLAGVRSWAAKLTGQLVRIAALIHIAERIDGDAWREPVGLETWRRAEAFADYLIPHARAAFHAMRVDGAFGEARVILDWIAGRKCPLFTRRELFDHLRGTRFQKVEHLEPALALLVEHGYLRRLPDGKLGARGGRPEQHRYEAHPVLLTGETGS
jgi:hypothetical protein